MLAVIPRHHASAAFVFTQWNNQTGWPSGVAFLAGMLNGAYAIGTPDAVTHIAEELPNPRRDLPKAVVAQMAIGTVCKSFYDRCIPLLIFYISFAVLCNRNHVFHYRSKRSIEHRDFLPPRGDIPSSH
jgi:amino acid transporter